MSAPLWGIPVVETPLLRQGQVLLHFMGENSRIIVGTRPPTEIQRVVMDGIVAAHPWFRDPLRADVMAGLRAAAS